MKKYHRFYNEADIIEQGSYDNIDEVIEYAYGYGQYYNLENKKDVIVNIIINKNYNYSSEIPKDHLSSSPTLQPAKEKLPRYIVCLYIIIVFVLLLQLFV